MGKKEVTKTIQISNTDERDNFNTEKSKAEVKSQQENKSIADQVALQKDTVNLLNDEDTLELKQKRQERAIEEIRVQLADEMQQLGEKATIENKKKMFAFQCQFDTYLEEFEEQVERTFKEKIIRSRDGVSKVIDDVVLNNFNLLIEKNEKEVELKERLLNSSEEDKIIKTTELTAQIREIKNILKNSYVEIKTELEAIAIDTIQQVTA